MDSMNCDSYWRGNIKREQSGKEERLGVADACASQTGFFLGMKPNCGVDVRQLNFQEPSLMFKVAGCAEINWIGRKEATSFS
jgi:hypothetical protein